MTIGQDCLVGIGAEAVQALVDGRHGDPFSILGPHNRGSTLIVRALAPGAQTVDAVSPRGFRASSAVLSSPIPAVSSPVRLSAAAPTSCA